MDKKEYTLAKPVCVETFISKEVLEENRINLAKQMDRLAEKFIELDKEGL